MFSFKIIPDWKHAWKYPSVNLPAFALAIQGTLAADPQALNFVPERFRHIIVTIALLYAAYDRLKAHTPAGDVVPNPQLGQKAAP